MSAPPCPGCEGRGYELVKRAGWWVREKCIVCNGTKRLPLNHYERMARDHDRIAGIVRAQRRR